MALSLPTAPDRLTRLRYVLHQLLPAPVPARPLQWWRMATLPFWIGSDVPPPMLPRRHTDAIERETLLPVETYLFSILDGLQTRFWLSWWLSAVLRGCSLGALVALAWVLIAPLGFLPAPSVTPIVLLAGIGALPGLVFGWLNRPSIHRVATMLDRTFDLDERLVTAIDPRERSSHEFETMQQADAANALASIRSEIRTVSLVPVREFVLLMVIGMTVIAVWMFAFDTRGIDALTDTRVPGYYPASERMANQAGPLPRIPTPAPAAANEQQLPATTSQSATNDDLKDLGALGKAFDQHDLTQSVANEIAGGDLSGAASALDAAANDIGAAPAEDRNALADDLDQAADAMSPANKDLADQTRQSADDIRTGGSQAEQGVSDLANEIDKKAPQPATEQQGDAGSSGSSGQQAPVGEQSQNSQSGSSDTGDTAASDAQPSSNQSDPGAGVAAEPGIAGESTDQDSGSGDAQGASQSGGESGPSSGSGSSAGDSAAQGAGQPQDSSGNASEPGGDANSGNSNSSTSGNEEDANSSQGSGAGSGHTDQAAPPTDQSDPNTASDANADKPEPPETAGNGEPPTAPIGETGAGGGNASGSGDNTLVIGGSSDDTVQAGNDIGAASLGGGSAGAGAASGDAKSQPVGPAGPDSNHVPADVEDVVKNYFSEPVP